MFNFEFITQGIHEYFAAPAPRMVDEISDLKNEILYCSGLYGNATFKQYSCKEFVMWIREFDTKTDTTIKVMSELPFFSLHIVAYGNIPHFAVGFGEFFFGEQEYNLFFGPQLDLTTHQKKGYNCVVDIHYSLKYLAKWSMHLRPMRDFLTKRDQSAVGKIFQVNPKLSPGAMETIRKIENCHYTGDERMDFISTKGLELLLMCLYPDNTAQYDNYNLKTDEIDRISKVKEYLLANYEEPLNMKKLVRMSGLNEWSLRKGFKLLYGMPLYKFLMNRRMEVAKELLSQEDLSVTQVAYHVGYGNHSNFINAFKKVMGFPPGKLKRGE